MDVAESKVRQKGYRFVGSFTELPDQIGPGAPPTWLWDPVDADDVAKAVERQKAESDSAPPVPDGPAIRWDSAREAAWIW